MAGLGGGSGCASPSAGGRDSRQQQTAAAAGDAGTRPSGRDRRAESSPAGGLRRGAASKPGTQTGWPGGRAEVIGTDCRILLWGVERAGVIFDDAEKGASVVPKNAKRKKRRRVHGRVRRGRRRLFRPAVRIEGATGWAGCVCVCVYCRQMEELRGRVFTSWVPGLEDGMFGGERQPARTGTGARRMSWVWSVRLSLFCAASFIPAPFPWIPASVSNFLPHQSPRALGATLFSPVATAFRPFANRHEKSTSCPSFCCPLGANQKHPHSTDKTSDMFPFANAVHRYPCHRQVRGKKGGTGARRGCCWAGRLGGRIAHATQLLDVVGLSSVDCRWERTGFAAQLSAFCFSPSPTAMPGKLRHHQLALPSAATLLWRVHNVVSRGVGTMSAYCLLARHCHWTLDSEWLGGRGHGLEAELCHPIPFPIVLSILESRFSWAARRHQDWPRQAGQRSTNSNDAANRIRSHHHASLAWDGIQGAGRQPDMPGSIFNLARIPDLQNCLSGAGCPGRHPEQTRVGSA